MVLPLLLLNQGNRRNVKMSPCGLDIVLDWHCEATVAKQHSTLAYRERHLLFLLSLQYCENVEKRHLKNECSVCVGPLGLLTGSRSVRIPFCGCVGICLNHLTSPFGAKPPEHPKLLMRACSLQDSGRGWMFVGSLLLAGRPRLVKGH